jgi:hypothetical protein
MTNLVSLAGLCVIIRGWTGFPVPKVNGVIFGVFASAFLERLLLFIRSEANRPVDPASAISIWNVDRLNLIPSAR